MRRALAQTTRIQLGDILLSTDDPLFEATLLRIIDTVMLSVILANDLMIEARTLIRLHITIARRIITLMDTVADFTEAVVYAPGAAVGRMAEDWTLFWFKLSWNWWRV